MKQLACKVSIDLMAEQRREWANEALEGAKDTRQSEIFNELEEWIEKELSFRKDTICHGISAQDLFIDILETAPLAEWFDKWKDDTAKMIVEEEFKS